MFWNGEKRTKISDSSGWGVGLLSAVALASCGGSQTPTATQLPTVTNAATARIEPAHGGAFTANYSGTYEYGPCGTDCEESDFGGHGRASFLGKSTEGVTLTLYAGHDVTGPATLTSTRIPSNSVSFQLTGGQTLPCPGVGGTLSWTVTGGTGKFAQATGSGTMTFKCVPSGYSDEWSGTLSF